MNVCSLSSHFCVFVCAKLVSSGTHLSPATTEKLVYVYSNRKMAATVSDADELKMLAWENGDV